MNIEYRCIETFYSHLFGRVRFTVGRWYRFNPEHSGRTSRGSELIALVDNEGLICTFVDIPDGMQIHGVFSDYFDPTERPYRDAEKELLDFIKVHS